MSEFLSVLLEKYQVRRSKKQKDDFVTYAQAVAHSAGYPFREEINKKSRNLIAGDVEKAKVIFTAHYDTCAEMPLPNLIYPESKVKTFLAQMPLVLIMLALSFGAAFLVGKLGGGRVEIFLAWYVVYLGLFALIYFGPSNPHTANDNTSGVAALMEIMNALPQEMKHDAAFIFFDQEELGKVGSKAYAKAHPGITEGKVLLNLDCVGVGDDFLIVAPKKADEKLKAALKAAFQDEGGKRAVHCGAEKVSYNSDQKSFPNGAAVAACQKGKWGYHVPRIHTRRDVICEESNLQYVTACAVKLMEFVSNQ